MNTPQTDRETINKLIDLLSDKTLEFGCRFLVHEFGDDLIVLSKVDESISYCEENGRIGLEYNHPWQVEDYPELPVVQESEIVKILGKPIMIGDVLVKMEAGVKRQRVVDLWEDCGFTNSFQEIVERSGWEEVELTDALF